jgi:flavin reductase (DIM6/NTAB) family NADH-FMN oxidoreductase RutF
MAALREADATGKGQFVDVAMYDAMISLCERMVYLHDITGKVPGPEGNGHPFLSPFGLYPAKDGQIALGIVDDAFWQRLAELMRQPELGPDPRFATRAQRAKNAAEIDRVVSAWSSQLSKAELTSLLGGQVPFGPLNTIADIANDPHVASREMLAKVSGPDPSQKPWTVAANPLRFSAHGHGPLAPPPALGADNTMLDSLTPKTPMDPEIKRSLRDAFGRFATGVTIVTTRQEDGTPRGFTANSFTSVSLDPPLLLVCIGKAAHSCDTFASSEHFTVNILADDQKDVSGLFASQSTQKFDIAKWHADEQDMPVINGALASFSCTNHKLVDAGDHLILIGRVLDFETEDGRPLGYYKGSYFDIGLDRAVTEAATTGGGTVAAVLSHENGLLLTEDADGNLLLPTAQSMNELVQSFKGSGLTPELAHLYAVYQVGGTSSQRIVYHGVVQGTPGKTQNFYALGELPFERINDKAERSLLRRYAKENQHGSFGIYHGTEDEGVVHRLAGHHKYHV